MRIIIFAAWGGIWPVPILKKILRYDKIEVIKIYSQGVHKKRINKYSDFFSENYKDNVAALIEKENFNSYELIKSANQQKVINFIKENSFDYIFTIGYGEIIKKELINEARNKIINFHPGLLPENCGADPFVSSLTNQNKKSGVTLHYIDEGIDSGEILFRKEILLSKNESYNSIQLKLSLLISNYLPIFFDNLKSGNIRPLKQNSINRKYYSKSSKSDKKINFLMSTNHISELVNAFKGQYYKSFFVYGEHTIYVGNCEFVDIETNFISGEIIDQGLGYVIITCSNGAVILSDLRVDNYSPEKSLILINKIFNE